MPYAAPMNESKLTKKMIDRIRALPEPSHARKVHGDRFGAGEPDIDACVSGRAVKVEVKMPGRAPTALQAAALDKWEKAGATVGVAHNLEELDAILVRAREGGH